MHALTDQVVAVGIKRLSSTCWAHLAASSVSERYCAWKNRLSWLRLKIEMCLCKDLPEMVCKPRSPRSPWRRHQREVGIWLVYSRFCPVSPETSIVGQDTNRSQMFKFFVFADREAAIVEENSVQCTGQLELPLGQVWGDRRYGEDHQSAVSRQRDQRKPC